VKARHIPCNTLLLLVAVVAAVITTQVAAVLEAIDQVLLGSLQVAAHLLNQLLQFIPDLNIQLLLVLVAHQLARKLPGTLVITHHFHLLLQLVVALVVTHLVALVVLVVAEKVRRIVVALVQAVKAMEDQLVKALGVEVAVAVLV
jgi:hypothetical protein